MRLLHTADVHLGRATHGKLVGGVNSRLEDFGQTFLKFADTAVEKKVDLAVVAGDLFDTRRPGPLEIAAAVRALRVLSAAKIRTVIVPGNHDGMSTIADPRSSTLHWMADVEMPYVHCFLEPRVGVVGTNDWEAMLVTVPFPHKRAYDVTHPEVAMTDRVEMVSADVDATIRHMIEDARKRAGQGTPVIFVGHLTAVGGAAGPQRLMRSGWDVSISPDVLGAADYAALGHLHPQQMLRPNVWYAGAPDHHEFGEDDEKGFLLVDIEQATVENVPSNPRPMLVFEVWESEGWPAPGDYAAWWPVPPGAVEDATVLLKLHPSSSPKVPADVLAAYRRTLLDQGAFLVKDETVVPEAQRRARVEIDPEVDELAAVERWAKSKGIDPAKVLPVAEELIGSFRVEP